jgi:hypothetical protein
VQFTFTIKMATRYDVYRFNTDDSANPKDSDVLHSVGLAVGEYTCPYSVLQSTGNATTPFAVSDSGSRVVTVIQFLDSGVVFQAEQPTADVDNSAQNEHMFAVVGEPGIYGSYKLQPKPYKSIFSLCKRTVMFVPSSMSLTANQAWTIMKSYLADPALYDCK